MNIKQKKQIRKLEDEVRKLNGRRRFDPTKAFQQNPDKENSMASRPSNAHTSEPVKVYQEFKEDVVKSPKLKPVDSPLYSKVAQSPREKGSPLRQRNPNL